MKLKEIVPWGRNLIEYIKMFSLTPQDISKKILDCAGGPSSFNYEMTNLQGHVISVDPVYSLSRAELEAKINETKEIILEELVKNKDDYVEGKFKSDEEMVNIRLAAMNLFLDDYEKGKAEKRYILAELPNLPFESKQFDIALCSHFLFAYSDNLTLEFHLDSIREMARVANEVRIFPTFSINGGKSDYIEPVIKELSKNTYFVELQKVDYEVQKGLNQILVVREE